MMERLVECVPNFSEGRNAETIQALVSAVQAVHGVVLLDQEMDRDHHRTVLTFVGAPEGVAEAAFAVTRKAAALINLQFHQGGHPRVGATDVVPFVPIRGITMADCVALAKQVGERIGRELGIPVFLYQEAASHPGRVNLEEIRRGGPDGLARRMETHAAWRPDFGPARVHPTAGVSVVGARPPLIAYNVNLETRDLVVAKAIAKIVRFSSGGLPHLKAIGVELASRGIVQVSMNLTNFEKTPIHVAFEAVRREAEQRGVPVSGSEIIGLVPQRALLQSSQHFLKLEGFDPTLVLETRLEMALGGEAIPRGEESKGVTGRMPTESSTWDAGLSSFLEAVAAGTPTPGGGSVAALAGALAAALGVMACRVGSPPKQKQPPGVSPPTGEYPAQMNAAKLSLGSVERRLLEIGEELRRLIQADAEAYAGVIQAYRLPKTDSSRLETISTSLQAATEVPLETASLASEAGILLRNLLSQIKPAVASDLKVGLLMATAAIEAGLENAVENLKVQTNQRLINDCSGRIAHIKESLVELKRL